MMGIRNSEFGIRNGRRGAFTLVEVLAAILILAIALPSIMYGLTLAGNLATTARRRSEATALAETKLNELLVTGDWQSGNQAGDFADQFPDYKWQATVSTWEETNTDEVDMRVTWMQKGQEQAVVLSTVVYTSAGGTP